MTATLATLVANARERDGVAFQAPDRATPYSYREFCANVWKAASLLGQYGAHPGADVAVTFATTSGSPPSAGGVDGSVPLTAVEPLLGLLGGALLGSQVDVDPLADGGREPIDARVLLRPVGEDWRERYATSARCSTLVYGGSPENTTETGFEGALWGQNPTPPPESVEPSAVAIRRESREYTHGTLVAAVDWVTTTFDLDEGVRVGIAADVRRPATLVAGVLAPLAAGATVVLGAPEAANVDILVRPPSRDDSAEGDGDSTISVREVAERLDEA